MTTSNGGRSQSARARPSWTVAAAVLDVTRTSTRPRSYTPQSSTGNCKYERKARIHVDVPTPPATPATYSGRGLVPAASLRISKPATPNGSSISRHRTRDAQPARVHRGPGLWVNDRRLPESASPCDTCNCGVELGEVIRNPRPSTRLPLDPLPNSGSAPLLVMSSPYAAGPTVIRRDKSSAVMTQPGGNSVRVGLFHTGPWRCTDPAGVLSERSPHERPLSTNDRQLPRRRGAGAPHSQLTVCDHARPEISRGLVVAITLSTVHPNLAMRQAMRWLFLPASTRPQACDHSPTLGVTHATPA